MVDILRSRSIANRQSRNFSRSSLAICRRIAGAGLVILNPICSAITDAKAAEIIVTWISVEHGARPIAATWRTPKSVSLVLHGGNVISDKYTVRHASGR